MRIVPPIPPQADSNNEPAPSAESLTACPVENITVPVALEIDCTIALSRSPAPSRQSCMAPPTAGIILDAPSEMELIVFPKIFPKL